MTRRLPIMTLPKPPTEGITREEARALSHSARLRALGLSRKGIENIEREIISDSEAYEEARVAGKVRLALALHMASATLGPVAITCLEQ